MTVLERLNYDKKEIIKHYVAWTKGPGMCCMDIDGCMSRYDSLRCSYNEDNFRTFLEWGLADYKEFSDGQLCSNGEVIVKANVKDCMKVLSFNLFSTGWAYHLDCLRKEKKDLSKPFSGYEGLEFRQSIPNTWTEKSKKELLDKIDICLDEHDPEPKPDEICHINVYAGLSDKEKQFYIQYDKVLRTAKASILNGTFALDKEYITEILGKDYYNK